MNHLNRFLPKFIIFLLLILIGSYPVIALASDAHQLPDPTQPYLAAVIKPGYTTHWNLQSTLISSQRHIAIINGRAYQLGDRLGSYTISDIRPHQVTLIQPHKSIIIAMLGHKMNKKQPTRIAYAP